MAQSVDAGDLKSLVRKGMWVRIPPRARNLPNGLQSSDVTATYSDHCGHQDNLKTAVLGDEIEKFPYSAVSRSEPSQDGWHLDASDSDEARHTRAVASNGPMRTQLGAAPAHSAAVEGPTGQCVQSGR